VASTRRDDGAPGCGGDGGDDASLGAQARRNTTLVPTFVVTRFKSAVKPTGAEHLTLQGRPTRNPIDLGAVF
jgi:hypothetical protein